MKPCIVVVLTLFACCRSLPAALYDIDFETPDQALGQTVQVGPAPNHVSNVMFGSPRVVASFGGLSHQPLLFDPAATDTLHPFDYHYAQIRLQMPETPTPTLDISFDATSIGTTHFLTLHLETLSSIRNFEIGSHHFTFNNPFEPVVNFGRYTDARPFRFSVHIDYALDSWSVFKDGTLISQGAFGNSGQVSSIRFNYAGADIDTGGVAIDNLLIAVPEPNLPMSYALLAVAIALRRIRRPARVARTPVAGAPVGPHGSS